VRPRYEYRSTQLVVDLGCPKFINEQGVDITGNSFSCEGTSVERMAELGGADGSIDPVARFMQMFAARKLQLYLAQPESVIPKWEFVSNWMQRLFTLSAYNGNFWFYYR
jgi:hypothetical protein